MWQLAGCCGRNTCVVDNVSGFFDRQRTHLARNSPESTKRMDDKLLCINSRIIELDDSVYVCSVDNNLGHARLVVVPQRNL